MSAKKQCRDVAAFLKDRARHCGYDDAPVFYGDLAKHFGFPMVMKPWPTHPLCGIFDELDNEDAKCRRPFLTALVVSKEEGIPGLGFFKTLAKLCPQKPQPKTEDGKRKLHLAELTRLLKFYGHAI